MLSGPSAIDHVLSPEHLCVPLELALFGPMAHSHRLSLYSCLPASHVPPLFPSLLVFALLAGEDVSLDLWASSYFDALPTPLR